MSDGYRREAVNGQCLLILRVDGVDRVVQRSAAPTPAAFGPSDDTAQQATDRAREQLAAPAPAVVQLVPTRIGNVPLLSDAGRRALGRILDSPWSIDMLQHDATDDAFRAIKAELDAHDLLADAIRAA